MNCLVFRFSAMGDVALTVPVLRSVLEQNQNLNITFVSNKAFEPFFHDIPRFEFYGINLDNYKGILGLYTLYKELNRYQKWDCVTDLHSVMRTWVISKFFMWAGVPIYTIDKGRAEKKLLTQKSNKNIRQLPHTTERYKRVFEDAGIKCQLDYKDSIHPSVKVDLKFDPNKHWIGIAPFSKHTQKEWPLDKVESLVKSLSKTNNYEILLLGGGSQEEFLLKKLADTYDNTYSIAGKFDLSEEITLIKKLSLLVSMDSFNMHLASLLNVKVISIWGATHSNAGFGPVNGNDNYKVEIPIDELDCRPCSVFGNKPCHRGDFACMQRISVKMVMENINFALDNGIKKEV
jgi:ADP-heptose:LPS heptosyltransferase